MFMIIFEGFIFKVKLPALYIKKVHVKHLAILKIFFLSVTLFWISFKIFIKQKKAQQPNNFNQKHKDKILA